MLFWNSLAFLMIQRMLAIWTLILLPFLKLAWTSGSSRFMYCLENFEHYFTSVWDECNCEVVWAFFGIALGFPGGSEVKVSACNTGNLGWIPGSGRSPGEGNGNPLQYSCLENPMGGGARWATVHWVTKSWTRLSDFTFTFFGIGMKTDLSGYYNWLLVACQPTATSLTCAVA